MFLLIFLVVIVYALIFQSLRRFGRLWVNPLFFVLIYYFFNYPLRAILIVYFPEQFNARYAFTDYEVVAGLVYSTVYVLVFGGTYLALIERYAVRFDFDGLARMPVAFSFYFILVVTVILTGIVSIAYEISVGGSFSLGGDVEELQRPFLINLVSVPYTLKWFAIFLGVLIWLKTKNTAVALTLSVVSALIMVESVVVTSKGAFVTFALVFFYIDNLLNGKLLRLSVLLPAIATGFVFSAYSYHARVSGGLGQGSLGEYWDFVRNFLQGDVAAEVDDSAINLIDRGTYYLDGVLLMIRGNQSDVDHGSYTFGSLVELANLIPREFNITLEQYSFDRYVTNAVWGDWSFAQIFIGRIGESYFVLGIFGIVYAFIHAVIFGSVACQWKQLSRSLEGVAFFFALLLGWLNQDASLFYQIKSLIALVVSYILIKCVADIWTLRAKPHVPRTAHG